MKVILKENVDKLGKIGDVVRVSEGYARNYLLPRNLVIIADENNIKEMNHLKKSMEKKRQKTVKDAEAISQKLASYSCTIARKVGEQEKLFGSVTNADIAAVLAKDGYQIEKKQIHINDHIKQLGVYTVSVKLHPEVTSQLKVWVVADKK